MKPEELSDLNCVQFTVEIGTTASKQVKGPGLLVKMFFDEKDEYEHQRFYDKTTVTLEGLENASDKYIADIFKMLHHRVKESIDQWKGVQV